MQRAYGPFAFHFAVLMYMVLAISTASAQLVFDSVPTDGDAAVKGKPYAASKTMHTRVVLADGTVTTRDYQIREARDGNGRILVEAQTEIAVGTGRPPVVVVKLLDPEARTSLTWTSVTKVGTLTHLPMPGLRVPGSAKGTANVPAAVPKPQIIGHRMIQGMLTTGRRTEHAIAAGTVGNSQPTSIKREW